MLWNLCEHLVYYQNIPLNQILYVWFFPHELLKIINTCVWIYIRMRFVWSSYRSQVHITWIRLIRVKRLIIKISSEDRFLFYRQTKYLKEKKFVEWYHGWLKQRQTGRWIQPLNQWVRSYYKVGKIKCINRTFYKMKV